MKSPSLIEDANLLLSLLDDNKVIHLAVSHKVQSKFYHEITQVNRGEVFAYAERGIVREIRRAKHKGLREMLVCEPDCAPSWVLSREEGPASDYEVNLTYVKRPNDPVVPWPAP